MLTPVSGIASAKHSGVCETDDCISDRTLEGWDDEYLLSIALEFILKHAEEATLEHFTLGWGRPDPFTDMEEGNLQSGNMPTGNDDADEAWTDPVHKAPLISCAPSALPCAANPPWMVQEGSNPSSGAFCEAKDNGGKQDASQFGGFKQNALSFGNIFNDSKLIGLWFTRAFEDM